MQRPNSLEVPNAWVHDIERLVRCEDLTKRSMLLGLSMYDTSEEFELVLKESLEIIVNNVNLSHLNILRT